MPKNVTEQDIINLIEAFDDALLESHGNDFLGTFEETTIVGDVFAQLVVEKIGLDEARSLVRTNECTDSHSEAFAQYNCPTYAKLSAPNN